MKKKNILTLLFSGFFLVIAWIGFSIYHAAVTSTISESVTGQITPINPRFDTQTLEQLKTRQRITPIYEAPARKEIVEQQATNAAAITPIEQTEEGLAP